MPCEDKISIDVLEALCYVSYVVGPKVYVVLYFSASFTFSLIS